MDSFLACHDNFPGNKWAVSAARENRKDAVTASSRAAIELLAMKVPENTMFVQHSGPLFSLLLFTHYIFFYFCFTSNQQVQ